MTNLVNRHFVLINYLAKLLDFEAEYSRPICVTGSVPKYYLDEYTCGMYLANENKKKSTIIYDFIFNRILLCSVENYESELIGLEVCSEEVWDCILDECIKWSDWQFCCPCAIVFINDRLEIVYGKEALEIDSTTIHAIEYLNPDMEEMNIRYLVFGAYKDILNQKSIIDLAAQTIANSQNTRSKLNSLVEKAIAKYK